MTMPRSVRARTGDASGLGRRAVVIAGGSATEAEADARAAGYEPVGVLDAAGLLRLGRGYRKAVRDTGADVAVLHSRAWGRQAYPQVFQLAMAATPLSERVLLDEEHGLRAIPRPLAFWQAARVPTDVVAGAGRVALEAVHHRRASRSVSALVPDVPADPHGIWLLAIWRNAADSRVGGSISHMGGILGGFRELGYRIALLTDTDTPEQLRAAADILEEVPAGPSSHRVTREAERVTSNARFRVAGERLMRQVRPAVVYQRHEYLFSAGALLAQHFNVPLVLEWNNSMTVSAVRAWLAPGPLDRPFQRFLAPLGARMERDVVRTATLIA